MEELASLQKWLYQILTIAGGTKVQLNIIAKQVLGLRIRRSITEL